MQYHIQTTPIWDAFKSDCNCPLCQIYAQAEERLVSQYLNEAVMEPDYRVKVNKLGFCTQHLRKLYAGENKLGLALQLSTRTEAVIKSLKEIKDVKTAKKQAERIRKNDSTCVICDTLDEMMERYAYTVAQMYKQEKDFPQLLKNCKGFCMPHYALLLENAGKAGNAASAYLFELSAFQISALTKTNNETLKFTEAFDYRSKSRGIKAPPDAVPNAIQRLKGKII